MKTRFAGIFVVMVAIAAPSEAGLFKRGSAKYRPPKAATPLTQGADETHKFTKGGPHNASKYQRPEWGNLWKQTLRLPGAPTIGHYNEF